MGDRGEQVHLLLPAGLGALALLAVDGDAPARGNVPGIPAYGGVEPGVLRVRPEPAVLPFLPEGFRGRRLPLLPLLLLPPLTQMIKQARAPAYAAGTAGSSAASASAPASAASNSSASSIAGIRYSVRADGATRRPVTG